MEFNYSYLRGFILDNNDLKTTKNYAKFLGISETALNYKFNNKHQFTQEQIMKTKHAFGLSAEQVALFFFTQSS